MGEADEEADGGTDKSCSAFIACAAGQCVTNFLSASQRRYWSLFVGFVIVLRKSRHYARFPEGYQIFSSVQWKPWGVWLEVRLFKSDRDIQYSVWFDVGHMRVQTVGTHHGV
jgi:hypothetical protein